MRIALTMLLALFALPYARAADPKVVAPVSLGQLHQVQGETDDAFLRRIARFMRDETARSGFEVCGDICVGPNGHGITVFTDHSQVACPVMRGCPLEAPNLTNRFIHTHPPINYPTLNIVDVQYVNANRVFFKKKAGRPMAVSPSQFSSDDYKVGPGYMIYRNDVYYQTGRGTQQLLFRLEP